MNFDIDEIRSYFPALESGDVFFDGPGGTQVTRQTMTAMKQYFIASNANFHGAFITSKRTDETTLEARTAMADFLNARSEKEIVFGNNMTSLTFNFSRAFGRKLSPGDEIIVSRLDHDANIAPWVELEERGIVVKYIDFHHDDCTLDLATLESKLNDKTKLVAVGYSSNMFGTVNKIEKIIATARKTKTLVFVDAVHYAPHAPIDVQALDCDFLVCSVYKFFGPHVGVLYGKYDLLNSIEAYKTRAAGDLPPDKFETGTQNFEGQAGLIATIDFLASCGKKYRDDFEGKFMSLDGRRRYLKIAMTAFEAYESGLFTFLMDELEKIPRLTIYGITDRNRFKERIPTVAFRVDGQTPKETAGELGQQGIYVWDGHCYAYEPVKQLGLLESGGLVRVGLSIYNSKEEVERFLVAIKRLAQRSVQHDGGTE